MERIVAILKQAELGIPIVELIRQVIRIVGEWMWCGYSRPQRSADYFRYRNCNW
jgi:hypothetical protein